MLKKKIENREATLPIKESNQKVSPKFRKLLGKIVKEYDEAFKKLAEL